MRSLIRLRWIVPLAFVLLSVSIYWAFRFQTPATDPKQASAGDASSPIATPASLTYLAPEIEKVVRPPLAGPDACQECHRDIHKSFFTTKHPRTLREVHVGDMPASITDRGSEFTTRDARVRFAVSREQERFYQTATEKWSQGERTAKSTVDLVLGAGGIADDVFLTWHANGNMRELPLAWLYPTNESACSHFDPNSGGDFGRLLTVRCIECHSTWVHHVPGTANQYQREGRILGVTCEACHGPASQHVQFHRDNPQEKRAHHIVQPSKLERERQIEVCTQCHSNAMKHLGPAFSYRPGQPLEQHYKTVVTKATEDDRVANQITYLRQSKCFIADQTMTCITCHDTHPTRATSNSGNDACAKCHQPAACKDRPNLPPKVQDDCVSCHMPSYLKININFQTKDDDYVPPLRRIEHRIAVYDHAKTEVLMKHFQSDESQASQQRAAQLQETLVKHFEKEVETCRSQYRYLGIVAALREIVRIKDSPEARNRLREAVQFQADLDKLATDAQRQLLENNSSQALATYERIVAIKPNDANAHGRLGTEYARVGNRTKAIEHWSAVAQHDPNDAYGLGMLAWQAFLERREADALELYKQAEAIEPRQAKMKYQMGLVLTRQGRLPEAIAKFKEALTIEPQHSEALQAVVFASLDAGTPQEAIPYAEFIARASQLKDVNSLSMLATVYQAAGHKSQALTALKIALPLAQTQAPELLAELKSKLMSLENDK